MRGRWRALWRRRSRHRPRYRETNMRVSLFGLGYVGCVTAACLAKCGHEVWGVDVSADKVGMINAGKSPIIEKGLAELIEESHANHRFRATTDPAEAVLN